ncbi:MAG: peptidoglycan-binding domain-containing protein [Chthoniobacterales bacterium]
MGKFLASLLSIVFQLFLIAPIFASDDVRKVQEELRKRHLFYGNPTGEITPSLTAAVARYQGIKGFPRTGIIDFQTRASLGVVQPEPRIASTPIVFESSESVRGANGERLPVSPSWAWLADERAIQIERATMEENHAVAALPGSAIETVAPAEAPPKRHPSHRTRQIKPPKETNPFLLAFHSIDRAVKQLRGDADPKKKRVASRRL